MGCIGMAALAKQGGLAFQQGRVRGAMGCMTSQTILGHRRMLPQKRSSQLGMAFEALQINRLCVHKLIGHGSVGVVAVCALHLAFPKRMVGLAQQLRFYLLMALVAGFVCIRPGQIVGIIGMDSMATGTRQVTVLMFAALPERLPALGMAFQADRTFGVG